MTLLTFFSAPKPFLDPRISTIQINAISSWTKLADVRVLLMGEDEGIQDAARQVGVQHVSGLRRNASGTPLISSMIELARSHSDSPLLCIINADMIILPDFLNAARVAGGLREPFVLLGRRWDMGISEALDFVNGWEERLRQQVQRDGRLHRPAGSDLFLFPRDAYATVPDFAVGRAGWDNWMIYEARRRKWRVIDGTPSFMIVHQDHDYSHLPGGLSHHSLPETEENIQLAGGEAAIRYTVLDATHVLVSGRLRRPELTYPRLMRLFELFLRGAFSFLPAPMIEEIARPKRWKRRLKRILGRPDGQPPGQDKAPRHDEGA